jgi:dedicator of cytokinesis protein 3
LFSCSRQIIKQVHGGEEEVWEEKTYFRTEEQFPTVLRRSEVIDVHIVEISAIENAITEIEQKTKDLASLELRYSSLAKTGQTVSTNALTSALNTAVDNLTAFQYRDTFLNPEYLSRHPERLQFVQRLNQVLLEQVRIIDSCLKLHSALCPQEMLPFHETMEKMFRKNFYDELQRLPTDALSEQMAHETITSRAPSIMTPGSHYQPSLYESASARKKTESMKPQRPPFIIPPLQLGRTDLDPSPVSPTLTHAPSVSEQSLLRQSSKQTPLQKHLAHLARYGMGAVSSGPGDRSLAGGSESPQSGGSPRGSFVNVGGHVDAAASGVSLVASTQGSLNSHNLKSRFSRFGSFNFGRREGGPSH